MSGGRSSPPDGALEGVAHAFGSEAAAVGAMEHEAVIGEGDAELHPLLEHHLPMGFEDRDRRGIKGDRAPTTQSLGLAHHHLASHRDDRLDELEPPGVQIDISPAQPEQRERLDHFQTRGVSRSVGLS